MTQIFNGENKQGLSGVTHVAANDVVMFTAEAASGGWGRAQMRVWVEKAPTTGDFIPSRDWIISGPDAIPLIVPGGLDIELTVEIINPEPGSTYSAWLT